MLTVRAPMGDFVISLSQCKRVCSAPDRLAVLLLRKKKKIDHEMKVLDEMFVAVSPFIQNFSEVDVELAHV